MFKVGYAVIVGLSLIAATVHAQLPAQLPSGVVQGGNGGLLGGAAGVPSPNNASVGNLAGVLQYCIQNKYLSAGGASSMKDSLLSRVTGGTRNSEYQSGSNGLLETGNGQNYSLGGSGLKQQLTEKACDLVLQHAKSLL